MKYKLKDITHIIDQVCDNEERRALFLGKAGITLTLDWQQGRMLKMKELTYAYLDYRFEKIG